MSTVLFLFSFLMIGLRVLLDSVMTIIKSSINFQFYAYKPIVKSYDMTVQLLLSFGVWLLSV